MASNNGTGEQAIREAAAHAAQVEDSASAFLGFCSVDKVRDRLVELDKGLPANINLAYEDEYIAAAAALEFFNSAEAERLAIKLKGKGISKTSWQRVVHERGRKERERKSEEAKSAKADARQASRHGAAAKLTEVEPAAQPVTNGGLLLSRVLTFIRRFVHITEVQATAIVLWVAFVYAFTVADHSPRLAILSAKKRSGKTRLESVIEMLVPRALRSSNMSAAVVYRIIEETRRTLNKAPTILLDEVDSFVFTGRRGAVSEHTEAIRGIVNSGHTPEGAFVSRIEKIGDQLVPVNYSTWAPICFAAIGRLPDTWEDRSIVILMKRRLKAEPVEKLSRRNRKLIKAEAAGLASELARWVGDNLDHLRNATPELPAGLDDRCEDNWDLLLALGELAGDTWKAAAQKAARELSTHRNDGADDALDIKLLVDIEKILDQGDSKEDGIGSTELAKALAAIEGSLWQSFGRSQKPLTTTRLAMMLAPFELYPSHQHKGSEYAISALRDALLRYVPKNPPEGVNPSQPSGREGENTKKQSVTEPFGDNLKNGSSATGSWGSGTVTGQNGLFGMDAEKNKADDAEVF